MPGLFRIDMAGGEGASNLQGAETRNLWKLWQEQQAREASRRGIAATPRSTPSVTPDGGGRGTAYGGGAEEDPRRLMGVRIDGQHPVAPAQSTSPEQLQALDQKYRFAEKYGHLGKFDRRMRNWTHDPQQAEKFAEEQKAHRERVRQTETATAALKNTEAQLKLQGEALRQQKTQEEISLAREGAKLANEKFQEEIRKGRWEEAQKAREEANRHEEEVRKLETEALEARQEEINARRRAAEEERLAQKEAERQRVAEQKYNDQKKIDDAKEERYQAKELRERQEFEAEYRREKIEDLKSFEFAGDTVELDRLDEMIRKMDEEIAKGKLHGEDVSAMETAREGRKTKYDQKAEELEKNIRAALGEGDGEQVDIKAKARERRVAQDEEQRSGATTQMRQMMEESSSPALGLNAYLEHAIKKGVPPDQYDVLARMAKDMLPGYVPPPHPAAPARFDAEPGGLERLYDEFGTADRQVELEKERARNIKLKKGVRDAEKELGKEDSSVSYDPDNVAYLRDQGMTTSEIARELGVPYEQVMSTLVRTEGKDAAKKEEQEFGLFQEARAEERKKREALAGAQRWSGHGRPREQDSGEDFLYQITGLPRGERERMWKRQFHNRTFEDAMRDLYAMFDGPIPPHVWDEIAEAVGGTVRDAGRSLREGVQESTESTRDALTRERENWRRR